MRTRSRVYKHARSCVRTLFVCTFGLFGGFGMAEANDDDRRRRGRCTIKSVRCQTHCTIVVGPAAPRASRPHGSCNTSPYAPDLSQPAPPPAMLKHYEVHTLTMRQRINKMLDSRHQPHLYALVGVGYLGPPSGIDSASLPTWRLSGGPLIEGTLGYRISRLFSIQAEGSIAVMNVAERLGGARGNIGALRGALGLRLTLPWFRHMDPFLDITVGRVSWVGGSDLMDKLGYRPALPDGIDATIGGGFAVPIVIPQLMLSLRARYHRSWLDGARDLRPGEATARFNGGALSIMVGIAIHVHNYGSSCATAACKPLR